MRALAISHRSAIGPDNPRFGAKWAIDPAATDQSKLGGRDSWTARWQKRARREAFDCNDWFGGGIRRGPQSGCGPSSRIAGKQERSSSQVTLELSPDLEVGGACAQQGGALARHRSALECSAVITPACSARRAKASYAFISASKAGSYCLPHLREGFIQISRGYPTSPAPWLGCFDQDAR